MLNIQHNLLAQNANRQLGINTNKNTKITEKLSSGYKINRAADDAAGLAISEKMRRQVRGLNQGASNIKDGIGYVQTAEGALNEVHDMLQRINELAVQAANGTNTVTDRAYIDSEIQALKAEMQRIFTTTSFNERKIWVPQELREVIGTTEVAAVSFVDTHQYNVDITNNTCGIIPLSSGDSRDSDYNYGFKINADEDGVNVSWLAYDGNTYETEIIPWNELEAKNYRFNINEYFGGPDKNPNLYGPDGETDPLLSYEIAFSPHRNAERSDIIESINGQRVNVGTSASMRARFEGNNTDPVTYRDRDGDESIKIISYSLSYRAAFASNHNTGTGNNTENDIVYNFDEETEEERKKPYDDFLMPVDSSGRLVQTMGSGGNLTSIPSDSTGTWQFSFYMGGIGTVKATSTGGSYNAPEYGEDYRFFWWDYRKIYNQDRTEFTYDYSRKENRGSIPLPSGTLGAVMGTLTGQTRERPGLLNRDERGYSSCGGYININFKLTADSEYEYGNATSDEIGSFTIQIKVKASDDEAKVLDRINNVLNSNTILDCYVPNGSATYGRADFYTAGSTGHQITIDVFGDVFPGGTNDFFVQAGAEAGQHISIEYEALNLEIIGLEDTNVLTQESAGNAIDEVKGALQRISEQRSDFGAYQNRLEHAYNINNNTSENTQSAESVIRDADIADMMMEYSINNILMQAGTSMLAQANQSNQTAVELLQ